MRAPRVFAVPANTLVVADTVGFHARGLSARPSVRVEIWTYGRRNPFLPWTGLDPGSIPGIAERRIPFLWKVRDFLDTKAWLWPALEGRRNTQAARPAWPATCLSEVIGRAPTWLMTSAAASEPSRPQTS